MQLRLDLAVTPIGVFRTPIAGRYDQQEPLCIHHDANQASKTSSGIIIIILGANDAFGVEPQTIERPKWPRLAAALDWRYCQTVDANYESGFEDADYQPTLFPLIDGIPQWQVTEQHQSG